MKRQIEKALVDLQGKAFKTFIANRETWKVQDAYLFPGPMQFQVDTDLLPIPVSLSLEMGSI